VAQGGAAQVVGVQLDLVGDRSPARSPVITAQEKSRCAGVQLRAVWLIIKIVQSLLDDGHPQHLVAMATTAAAGELAGAKISGCCGRHGVGNNPATAPKSTTG
jgi:hypothetical protein